MTLPTPPPVRPDDWGTDVPTVDDMLGPSVDFAADPLAELFVDAANEWSWDKRFAAGYHDDTAPASARVKIGCSLYAVALFRERQAVDGFQSFEDFASTAPISGSLGQIRRMLGIGRARVDSAGVDVAAYSAARRRRRMGWRW